MNIKLSGGPFDGTHIQMNSTPPVLFFASPDNGVHFIAEEGKGRHLARPVLRDSHYQYRKGSRVAGIWNYLFNGTWEVVDVGLDGR